MNAATFAPPLFILRPLCQPQHFAMPHPFTLPTTSSTLLSAYFTCSSHPSLLLTATTRRSVLKDALKKHKRLSAQGKAGNLSTVQDAIVAYLPYLFALNTASGYRDIGSERVDVDVMKPLEVEWRATLSAALPVSSSLSLAKGNAE